MPKYINAEKFWDGICDHLDSMYGKDCHDFVKSFLEKQPNIDSLTCTHSLYNEGEQE